VTITLPFNKHDYQLVSLEQLALSFFSKHQESIKWELYGIETRKPRNHRRRSCEGPGVRNLAKNVLRGSTTFCTLEKHEENCLCGKIMHTLNSSLGTNRVEHDT